MIDRIEIDFLPVGRMQRSGDAIAIRYGTNDTQSLMVVDGGDTVAGEALVNHLWSNYGYGVVVDDVVCTHSDGDHTSGLRILLQKIPVRRLWVHQPWLYADHLNPQFKGNWHDYNLANHLRTECFTFISQLCDVAEDYEIELCEPLAGAQIGPFVVLAPTLPRYLSLVPRMDQTPVSKVLAELAYGLGRSLPTINYSQFETWSYESLCNPGPNSTSIPNETSVVLFANVSGRRILLTGDAGIQSLTEAFNVSNFLNLDIVSPHLIQIPHHGSRHNVGPEILDKILGPRLNDINAKRGWAVASVAENCPKKPYRCVTNAFLRRGYRWTDTKGGLVNWRLAYPPRNDVILVGSGDFYNYVED